MEIEDVIKLIDEDIKYQTRLLVNNFEVDKPTQWRITGMRRLKRLIETGEVQGK